jgi:hypothetical protein
MGGVLSELDEHRFDMSNELLYEVEYEAGSK